MKYFLQNIKNSINFFIRQRLNFSRKNYCEKNESKDGIFVSAETIEREDALSQKFSLDYLKSNSTKLNYLENMYILDVLDMYLKIEHQDNLKVLDIGCKNWFYAKGEYFFFKKYCKNLTLDGIEIDPNQLYYNFYTRGEVAKFYIKGLNGANYIGKDFLNHNEKYDYIISILPFVIKEPLLIWGLPIACFKPEKMLEHAYKSLNKNGKLLIINQGEIEHKVQKEICKKLNINFSDIGEIKSSFLEYQPRYSILIEY